MSPFSTLFSELRRSRGIRQSKLAEVIGYEQSYISALEGGTKGPPAEDFMVKVKHALKLNRQEQESLDLASLKSIRKFMVPLDAPEQFYELCYELNNSTIYLRPSQIEILLNILRMLKNDNEEKR